MEGSGAPFHSLLGKTHCACSRPRRAVTSKMALALAREALNSRKLRGGLHTPLLRAALDPVRATTPQARETRFYLRSSRCRNTEGLGPSHSPVRSNTLSYPQHQSVQSHGIDIRQEHCPLPVTVPKFFNKLHSEDYVLPSGSTPNTQALEVIHIDIHRLTSYQLASGELTVGLLSRHAILRQQWCLDDIPLGCFSHHQGIIHPLGVAVNLSSRYAITSLGPTFSSAHLRSCSSSHCDTSRVPSPQKLATARSRRSIISPLACIKMLANMAMSTTDEPEAPGFIPSSSSLRCGDDMSSITA